MKKFSIIKIVLTILLFAVLFVKINLFDVANIILSLKCIYLLGAFILLPILYSIRTIRWNIFLRFFGINLRFIKLFKIMIIGIFYGLITPGKVGELGRAYHVTEKKMITLPTIIMEKIIDIATLIGLSLVTVLVYFPNDTIMLLIIVSLIIVLVLGVFFLLNSKLIYKLVKILGIQDNECDKFTHHFRKMLGNYSIMAKSFSLSFLYYIICYFICYFISLAAKFNPIVVITFPIIILMGNIPVTISGLGLRESVGSLLFTYLGEPPANGFVFAFLIFIVITVIPGIVGYFLLLRE